MPIFHTYSSGVTFKTYLTNGNCHLRSIFHLKKDPVQTNKLLKKDPVQTNKLCPA